MKHNLHRILLARGSEKMTVDALLPNDHEVWTLLWCGYLDFYRTELPPTIYEVAPERRGGGARILIKAAAAVWQRACPRPYWLTQQDNAAARLLYDKVAKFKGFVRYVYSMT